MMKVLYQMDIAGEEDPENAAHYLKQAAHLNEQEEYAKTLYSLYCTEREKADEQISAFSRRWSVRRMAKTDLAILRLATFEMLFYEACPVSVAINEAVDLAKAFGGEDDSPRFINGVLGRIADRYAELDDSVEEEAEDAAEAESEVSPEAESEASAEANA